MRIITVCQPYATLIALGLKPIENRTWCPSYRGALAIHAGKSRAWLDEGDEERYPGMPFGFVVAIARLVSCLQVGELPAALRDHEHANGPWCWVLEDVRPLRTPLPWVGCQGLAQLSDADRLRIEGAL